jgi:hypothetical protein
MACASARIRSPGRVVAAVASGIDDGPAEGFVVGFTAEFKVGVTEPAKSVSFVDPRIPVAGTPRDRGRRRSRRRFG